MRERVRGMEETLSPFLITAGRIRPLKGEEKTQAVRRLTAPSLFFSFEGIYLLLQRTSGVRQTKAQS